MATGVEEIALRGRLARLAEAGVTVGLPSLALSEGDGPEDAFRSIGEALDAIAAGLHDPMPPLGDGRRA